MVTLTINTQFKKGCQNSRATLFRIRRTNQVVREAKKQEEYLSDRADKKAILFDMMIDYAEKEFNIPIRKK